MKISREEFKKQIKARRLKKEAASKFARLRLVATKYPKHFSQAITVLANAFHEVGEGLHAMNDNLGLSAPPKTASLAVKAEAAKKFAANFRRIAEENPEEMAVALNEIYTSINELADGVEGLADNAGIELIAPVEGDTLADEVAEGHESVEGPEFVQEELGEASEAAAEGDMGEAAAEAEDAQDAAVADEVVTSATKKGPFDAEWREKHHLDEEDKGTPADPFGKDWVDAEALAKEGAGSDAFVTNRGENGEPMAPKAAFLKKRRK